MALILVLAVIVLLTAVVLTFFAQTTANRAVENMRSKITDSELLARSALDYVTGQFLAEIRDPSRSAVTTDSGIDTYFPAANENAIPERRVAAELLNNVDARTVVRQSVIGADPNASTDGSAAGARNGRIVSLSRWNLPRLIAGTGFSSDDELPAWVYVTPTSGVENQISGDVIGRFAYNVYEIGGLLNVNSAGYPSVVTQVARLKGSPAGANLALLGLSSDAVGDFVTFRSGAAASGSDNDFLASADRRRLEGFLSNIDPTVSPALASNYLTSRQDLLRYAAIKNPALSGALPYLTHFSRTINAPSWTPATSAGSSVDYEGLAGSSVSSNRNLTGVRFPADATVTRYRDDGTVETYDVAAGDPLLQYRFSLARLKWLTPQGPSAALSPAHPQYHPGGTEAAILSCFGLRWRGSEGRWIYEGHGGSPSGIKTLAEIAQEDREPDFFETLKAGILAGSLGLHTELSDPLVGNNSGTANVQEVLDGTRDLQIFKIGANIIDCADTDNYPTILYVNVDGLGVEIAGTENLPYLHGVDSMLLNEVDTATRRILELDLVWTPVFFNPHSPHSGVVLSGPGSVSAELSQGILSRITILAVTPTLQEGPILHPMTGQTFSLAANAFQNQPGTATGTGAQRLDALVPYVTASEDVLTFRMFSFRENAAGKLPFTYETLNSPMNSRTVMSNVQIALRYTNPDGISKIYSTLGGYHDGAQGIDMGTVRVDSNTGHSNRRNLSSVYYSMQWDPRSVRLGLSQGWTRSSAVSPLPDPDTDRVRTRDPFNWNTPATVFLYWGQWPQGDKNGGYRGAPKISYTNMRDPDAVTRPADGWLGNAANPYRNLSDPERRPVILQRPFRTVGELGYVFRDSPWKTLSFFDETSADGALLDLFSVTEEPAVTAGRVNLNTAPPPVLASLLYGANQTANDTVTLSETDAMAIARAYDTFAHGGTPAGGRMLRSLGEIPEFLASAEFASAISTPIKYQREATVRALADATQTRTWNLLIDVVAQSGRALAPASSGADFLVEGESRYWLSIAIDRYTGKIVDRQLELVME